jgi:hypothetical protein
MARYTFNETQRFTQLWIWGLLILVSAISIYGMASQPMEGWELVPLVVILGTVLGLFASMQLKTRIDESGLTFSFFPFIGDRKYNLEDIQKLELIEYNSIFKFGGWGIRYNFDMWAYNVRGKHGLVVHLKDKKFLLGTQKPEGIKKVIEQFRELKGGDYAS